MKVTEPEESGKYTALYEATIQQAVGGASGLMTRLVAVARASLRAFADKATERRERDNHTHARRLLNQFEPTLCARFTEELLTAFSRMASAERALPAADQPMHFDQIAQMDPTALQQRVVAARVQHTVQVAADASLGELNRLICRMLGLAEVRLERNPLRPAVYVEALTAALTHLPVPVGVRHHWIALMSGALGRELSAYYEQLCNQLRGRGVGSMGSVGGGDVRPAEPARSMLLSERRVSPFVTLEKLQILLAGSLDETDERVAQRFLPDMPAPVSNSALEAGDSAPTAFRATVPAALDAITDAQQLAQVVRRLQERGVAASANAEPAEPVRDQLRLSAHGADQALSLEVVAMMVDNMAHDPRLLAPVQQIVAALEPALMRLAMADPRFFSHKQHPARRLLHEITHRSIAFESVDSRGFSGFMEPLREAVAPLAEGEVGTAEPFDQVLTRLVGLWDEPAGKEKRQVEKAVKALQTAEQRSVLAITIVEAIQARPDAALVPDAVFDFLCGPWAQVVAHARVSDKSGADDPGGYAELIDGLMWSAQPHLTRNNVSALTRLVPKLLIRLRGGLATIDYPAHKTSGFFEVLMKLHQRGFKPGASAGATPDQQRVSARASGRSSNDGNTSGIVGTWVAPMEARVSGFIDLSTAIAPLPAEPPPSADALAVGVWVALQAEGSWTRTKLSWISPNGTLLLFTDALGFMQTLTRRACDQLFSTGQLRLISAHPVEDALDAVAQAALHNSVDVRF